MLLWGWSKQNPRGLPLDHMDHNWQSRNSPSCLLSFCPWRSSATLAGGPRDAENSRNWLPSGLKRCRRWSKWPCLIVSEGYFAVLPHFQVGFPVAERQAHQFLQTSYPAVLGFWFRCWLWTWRHFDLLWSPCRVTFSVRRQDSLANHGPFTKIISTLLSPNFWRIRKTDVGPKIPFVFLSAWWNMHPLWVV